MESEGKDEETLKDQPCCSYQRQDDEIEVMEAEKQHVDKVALLHQALSQASVVRAQRCKQQRITSLEMKGCDRNRQFTVESRFFQSNPSEETVSETKEFMAKCTKAIKSHKLYPIVELMLKKCEAATWDLSQGSFVMDDVFQQLAEMCSNGDSSLGNTELDVFLINSVIMLRLHLLELEKVAELCDDFKTKYLQTLRKKVNQESMIGYNGDSDDDMCNSSPEPPGQSKNHLPTTSHTIAVMATPKGMVSIPLWNPTAFHSSPLYSSLSQPSTSATCTSVIQIAEKQDAHLSADEDSFDLKRKAQLPAKAVDLLKTWLFLHSSHPYPSEEEKAVLSRETGLQMVQINNWFINARRRILVPPKESSSPALRNDIGMDFSQESNSTTGCSFIPKRIRSEDEKVADGQIERMGIGDQPCCYEKRCIVMDDL